MSHLTCLGMFSPPVQGPLRPTLGPRAALSKSASNEMLLAWQEGAWDPMDWATGLLRCPGPVHSPLSHLVNTGLLCVPMKGIRAR